MKAMIFAAGLGTRMKPLTDTTPKALIPIGGKTLLQHNLERLAAQGFTDIVINIHHFSEQIRTYLKENNNFGLNITLSDESDKLLDTGGGIKKAEKWLSDEPFLVHNVDILSNADLKGLYDKHCQSNALASLLVSNRKTSRYLLFDKKMSLKGWLNKSSGEILMISPDVQNEVYSPYAFSGIHVISPSIFRLMVRYPDCFPILKLYLKEAKNNSINGVLSEDLKMVDVGKIDTLNEVENTFENEIKQYYNS